MPVCLFKGRGLAIKLTKTLSLSFTLRCSPLNGQTDGLEGEKKTRLGQRTERRVLKSLSRSQARPIWFSAVWDLCLTLCLPISLFLTWINSYQRRTSLPSQWTHKMGLRPSSDSQLTAIGIAVIDWLHSHNYTTQGRMIYFYLKGRIKINFLDQSNSSNSTLKLLQIPFKSNLALFLKSKQKLK